QSGVSDLPVGLDSEYWWPREHYAVGVGKMQYLQPESLPLIQNELETRGFHEEEINGIMGQNMYRLARECW
ncbi:MAG: membrane dipeptidase, partial [Myxococcota bacterium]|nr:membrane dipeptidase [Myxococcota bacterium]